LNEAKAANVTVVHDMDEREPNISYDIEWWDKMSLEQLDRKYTDRWHTEAEEMCRRRDGSYGAGTEEK
jgi:hypothetical protein